MRAYAALAAVCFFWGTTYLGIRIALESFSPIYLVAMRFTISGAILLIAAKLLNAHFPKGRELWLTALFGLLILGIGNMCLAFSEELIPSGLAAIFATTSPFWMVGLEAARRGGDRLRAGALLGMVVGMFGTVLLVGPAAMQGLGGPVLKGFLILQIGSAAWSLGSILQRHIETTANAIVSGAIQQFATGVLYSVLALLLPRERFQFTARGAGAVLYLIIFGSIVGYSAYLYALERLPVSIFTVYTYINPAVAVCLGWLFYREHFGWRELAAMAVILAGVAIVKKFGAHGAPRPVHTGDTVAARR